ncbi:arachidonate 5-lipoxygenase [Labeo rohita]|uniref:Arachidonate 5-lipoxygenase n=1 Tax=Labeo rohita TaxID=84645 RepID=A0A498MMV3_LABRO|nr:arachidonate 5-lipoxygenase [Labeo rohita]
MDLKLQNEDFDKDYGDLCAEDDEMDAVHASEGQLPLGDKISLLKNHRHKELETRQQLFRIENLGLNELMKLFHSSWTDIADFGKIFMEIKNTVSEYVMQNWNEDFLFGYQFLNGSNPVMISKCMNLPDKFAITQEMVEGSLDRGRSLQEELKAGNIYIADNAVLEGVQANATDPNTQQYLAAPFCLLYKTSQNEIIPELLIPHVHLTIAINTAAREQLICESGLFDKANSTGGSAIGKVIQKAMQTFTYKSLCFPEAMKARGVDNKEDLPNYYYRDDGMMIWEAVKSFVFDVVKIYYGSDETVQEDKEIQAFVQDV